MPFDVGPTMQTTNGYGFAIRNTHRGPITVIEFVTKEEAEKLKPRSEKRLRTLSR